MGRRVALFGGSFNPPHIAHVLDVAYILGCLPVDEVLITPTFDHAFGKRLAPFEHRMEMTRQAMSMFGERVEVSDIERQLGGESRTIRVVEHLMAATPGLTISLVVGSDILDELHKWMDHTRLLGLVDLIVLRRKGFNEGDPRVVGPLIPEVSSTAIREALGRGNVTAVSDVVPSQVLAWIQEHDLYREES